MASTLLEQPPMPKQFNEQPREELRALRGCAASPYRLEVGFVKSQFWMWTWDVIPR